jgi:hypothetical protein
MGPNVLADLFAACFWFGTAATILSFVLGVGHHGPIHLPHLGHTHLPAGGLGRASAGSGITPINLTSILAFLVVFGAVGLALLGGLGGVIALIFAVVTGLVAGWLAFIFIARFLLRGETYLVDEPIIGTIGKVSIPIGVDHVGEIIYTRNDVRRSDGARSVDGQPIPAGEEVVIVAYTHGIATVQRWQEFLLKG